jgi:hypothetical protein
MTLLRTNDAQPTSSARLATSAVCETRTLLLDRLAGALEKLGRAKLSLETDAPTASSDTQSLRHQLDGLRSECGVVRRDLEVHRLSHGC